MAYVEIRPVHVADLLSREGHPFAARVLAARDDRTAERDAEPREFDGRAVARRTLGVAAGAMIVMGSVVGGVLGLNNGEPSHTPLATGEPVGAQPSPNTPGQPGQTPAVEGTVAPQFTNAAAAEPAPRTGATGSAGEIGAPAAVKPPKVKTPPAVPEQRAPSRPAPEQPAPNPPSSGPVQTLTEPVTSTVEQTGTVGETLNDVVAPVTGTVDNTLQPALSLIGGLLSR